MRIINLSMQLMLIVQVYVIVKTIFLGRMNNVHLEFDVIDEPKRSVLRQTKLFCFVDGKPCG